ncbi:pantoate--beta-alanine ligase [bacterium]|nr:pantoate--beta-alanine ligase [bacterium]
MEIITGITSMQNRTRELRAAGRRIGFIPTMGYLHEGHLSLVREARGRADVIIMSIFVNPAQFGPGEDFERYPRDMERDKILAEAAGTDIIFAPSAEEMYPRGFLTTVSVDRITRVMCGKSRPGHFDGVTTVCMKLFQIVRPHIAVFGRKDYQQSLVIRTMVKDLDLDLEIITAPIVREADGLAMSSRNKYLSADERERALRLSASLREAEAAIRRGERRGEAVVAAIRKRIEGHGVTIDYIAVSDPLTLEPVAVIGDHVLIAVAVYVGKTRLIDNLLIETNPGE